VASGVALTTASSSAKATSTPDGGGAVKAALYPCGRNSATIASSAGTARRSSRYRSLTRSTHGLAWVWTCTPASARREWLTMIIGEMPKRLDARSRGLTSIRCMQATFRRHAKA
jgi:hypothetical protein